MSDQPKPAMKWRNEFKTEYFFLYPFSHSTFFPSLLFPPFYPSFFPPFYPSFYSPIVNKREGSKGLQLLTQIIRWLWVKRTSLHFLKLIFLFHFSFISLLDLLCIPFILKHLYLSCFLATDFVIYCIYTRPALSIALCLKVISTTMMMKSKMSAKPR